MAVTVVTDVFCDKCSNWGNHSCGQKSDKQGALTEVLKAGWEFVTVNGNKELHCPECLGKVEHFWKPFYRGDRGVAVRFDQL
ncbi:MAG: hypothetical protein Q7K26_00640 [bacterium]|nr:hypothetical protein [bacterium]